MLYKIPVENIEALRAKAQKIAKKAEKYGARVVFEELGEEVREETEHGRTIYRKYITVEASGEARADGWQFVGSIEHTEHGNILRIIDGREVPARFSTCAPYCEHCKTERRRKETFIVYNEEREEFRQVGRACLAEYTHGLNVEQASALLQWERVASEATYHGGEAHRDFLPTGELLAYYAETVQKFGFAPSDSALSTRARGLTYWRMDNGGANLTEAERRAYKEEAERVQFNPANITGEEVAKMLDWAKSWTGAGSSYRDNLKVVASMEFCEVKHLGILASLPQAYRREIEREDKEREREQKRAEEGNASEYIGTVGERITLPVASAEVLTSWYTDFGETTLYKFTSPTGAVMTWKTGTGLHMDITKVKEITGTVKAHNVYNGVKQTELTRVKAR